MPRVIHRMQIGTIYPISHTRAALEVDAMLGKHFCIAGSDPVPVNRPPPHFILHQDLRSVAQGPHVMIDPWRTFRRVHRQWRTLTTPATRSALVLMNFEEHCEVFVTTAPAQSATSTAILAGAPAARGAKNRAAGRAVRGLPSICRSSSAGPRRAIPFQRNGQAR